MDENVGGVYTLYMCVAGGVKITVKCFIRSLEHLCPLVGILIAMSSMRCLTRYSDRRVVAVVNAFQPAPLKNYVWGTLYS